MKLSGFDNFANKDMYIIDWKLSYELIRSEALSVIATNVILMYQTFNWTMFQIRVFIFVASWVYWIFWKIGTNEQILKETNWTWGDELGYGLLGFIFNLFISRGNCSDEVVREMKNRMSS
jgi:hypothetical protein